MKMSNLLRIFHGEETGQGFVGLALIAGLGAAASYVNNALTALGSRLQGSVGTYPTPLATPLQKKTTIFSI